MDSTDRLVDIRSNERIARFPRLAAGFAGTVEFSQVHTNSHGGTAVAIAA
jgi:hypothetical protein